MVIETRGTIAAIATPPGYGGIGVVRISGPRAVGIAQKIFRGSESEARDMPDASTEHPPINFYPRRMYHGHIVDPDKEEVYDEVLLVFMPSPKSYTKEDVIEIQAHSGIIVLKTILNLVLRLGARIADPGEFTRRAYINGRLDLSQAEAVIDVIQAKTESSLKIATRQLEGAVGDAAKKIREKIFELKAMLEAYIDFPDEIGESGETQEFLNKAEKEILPIIEQVLDGYKKGHLFREGLRLVIIGRANVGKSSLLNRLLKQDRAIVTECPGTTRDSIEETINLSGLPVVLVDTAGWRDTDDPVERLGIDRTRGLAGGADLILFVVDAEKGFLSEDNDIYERIKGKDIILVINKTDLLKGAPPGVQPEHWRFSRVNHMSVKFDQGVELLEKSIYDYGTMGGGAIESLLVPNLRQNRLFQVAHDAIKTAVGGMAENMFPELIAVDIQEAMDAIDEITGVSAKADILDMVFSRFCIGK